MILAAGNVLDVIPANREGSGALVLKGAWDTPGSKLGSGLEAPAAVLGHKRYPLQYEPL